MRTISLIVFLFFSGLSGFGQVVSSPPISYITSASAVDPHGNLILFDMGYSVTILPPLGSVSSGTVSIPVLVPTPRVTLLSTRVTVVPGGTGQPISKLYAANFQVVGTGKWGLYAAATSYSMNNNQLVIGPRVLVAIDAGPSGTGLPTDFSGFLNTALNDGDLKLNPSNGSTPDTVFNIEPGGYLIPGATAAMPIKARIERTITFDGTRFTSTDVVLPQ